MGRDEQRLHEKDCGQEKEQPANEQNKAEPGPAFASWIGKDEGRYATGRNVLHQRYSIAYLSEQRKCRSFTGLLNQSFGVERWASGACFNLRAPPPPRPSNKSFFFASGPASSNAPSNISRTCRSCVPRPTTANTRLPC